jgi:predicted TIM-barrel enzyme
VKRLRICRAISVFADVKKKHCSHALTGDLDIVDEIKQAEFFLVDGIIITGARTTEPPNPAELRRAKKKSTVPVLISSGMTSKNIKTHFPLADGFIVGSTFREDGRFLGALDSRRLETFMKVFRSFALASRKSVRPFLRRINRRMFNTTP